VSSMLKPLTKEAIPRALAKAERYRLLSEPQGAESICRDVLRLEPDHQEALVQLLLALTDQFGHRNAGGVVDARAVVERLRGEYERLYYAGLICERWAKAQLQLGEPLKVVHGWLREAMDWYERAEARRPAGDDDAILRYNACLRLIERRAMTIPPVGPPPSASE
jgi:hypothetical protein